MKFSALLAKLTLETVELLLIVQVRLGPQAIAEEATRPPPLPPADSGIWGAMALTVSAVYNAKSMRGRQINRFFNLQDQGKLLLLVSAIRVYPSDHTLKR